MHKRKREEWFRYLVELHVGIDDEDKDGGSGEFVLRSSVAGGAGDEAAIDVVAEVVLPDDLRRGDYCVR